MSVQLKPEQAYAYSELLEILSFMEDEYINKIPKKLMNIFKQYSSNEYKKHINPDVPLEEQKLTETTSALLGMLMLNYWCESDNQKQKLKQTFEENERKYQEELREKYNPNNIFNNETSANLNVQAQDSTTSSQNVDISYINSTKLPIDYNSFPWYKKMFSKIKNFIYKLFKSKKNPT